MTSSPCCSNRHIRMTDDGIEEIVFHWKSPFKTFNSLPKCNKLHAHIYTLYTVLLWLSSITLHIPLKFKHESHTIFFLFFKCRFQYNVPAPRASECCNELGFWRWEFMEPAVEEYQEAEFSKKLDATVLMFCGWCVWGLDGPCVSHTAGDWGELQAIGSLELGLWSGGNSPFFMIFFSFDLFFWHPNLNFM